jgi:hypothetical protein
MKGGRNTPTPEWERNMITNKDGKKITPKQMAIRIFKADLEIVTAYWEDRWKGDGLMTEAECMKIQEQVNKLEKRIMAMLEKAGGK